MRPVTLVSKSFLLYTILSYYAMSYIMFVSSCWRLTRQYSASRPNALARVISFPTRDTLPTTRRPALATGPEPTQ
jgi:hypothetical protein